MDRMVGPFRVCHPLFLRTISPQPSGISDFFSIPSGTAKTTALAYAKYFVYFPAVTSARKSETLTLISYTTGQNLLNEHGIA